MNDILYDTYFCLLERPEVRALGALDVNLPHSTARFSKKTYELSSGLVFQEYAEAYRHWVDFGRSAGHEWRPGKDTILKIVLKAKDEPYLIDQWVAHHAAIVGFENLIILDTGSEDPEYIAKINKYSRDILVINYRKPYNHVHSTRNNSALYSLLRTNSKFVTIIDADEFLFGRRGNIYSGEMVNDVLRNTPEDVICGIWLNANIELEKSSSVLKFPISFSVDLSPSSIKAGAVAGKTVARTSIVYDIGHLGHNLHSADILPFISPQSFGDLFVVHLTSPIWTSTRALAHLIGKRYVTRSSVNDINEQVKNLLSSSSTPEPIRRYAHKYFAGSNSPKYNKIDNVFFSNALQEGSSTELAEVSDSLLAVDFSSLISERAEILQRGI